MIIGIISFLAALFLGLFVLKCDDYKQLEKNYKWLKEQQNSEKECVGADDIDLRPLNRRTVIEAIEANGYDVCPFPDKEEDNIIVFVRRPYATHFLIDIREKPYVKIIMPCHISAEHYNKNLIHKIANLYSDVFSMRKAVVTDEDNGYIEIQISVFEDKYGHFRDSLRWHLEYLHTFQIVGGSVYFALDNNQEPVISSRAECVLSRRRIDNYGR